MPMLAAMNKMKMKIKMVLLLVLYSYTLNGQDINRIFEPEYYNGKSLNELRRDSQILDIVIGEEKPLFLKIKTEIGIQEFFRLNDTSFQSRKYIGDELIEEGLFVFNKLENIPVDSFTTFDPETYAETLNIISYHKLKKSGKWTENNNSGESWHGAYINEKKEGFWIYYDKDGQFNSCRFKEDEIVGLFSPKKSNLDLFQNWLFEKEFIWCKRTLYSRNDTIYKREWELSLNPDDKCLNLGKFRFNKNGSFQFDEVNEKLVLAIKKSGLGKWSFNEFSELELEFNDGDKITLSIKYFGKEYIRLEHSSQQ
jgi:hypothetical protein